MYVNSQCHFWVIYSSETLFESSWSKAIFMSSPQQHQDSRPLSLDININARALPQELFSSWAIPRMFWVRSNWLDVGVVQEFWSLVHVYSFPLSTRVGHPEPEGRVLQYTPCMHKLNKLLDKTLFSFWFGNCDAFYCCKINCNKHFIEAGLT